ncbi:ESX secretion-associated protein EspG [Nocardia sp. BMG51109]|uniref:ESX secretion-associated protein EspG n=1 Tax=Nocardia sp. BMG51109 TaxID=1056816 RepID=UPI000464B180|nr:ESX secretion-associated protein EspG [Nocardia sp. BMG51109]
MNRTWQVSDIELVAEWETLKEGSLPKPLTYMSRTPLLTDHLREKADALASVRQRLGEELRVLLATLADADIRIVVRGRDGRDPDNPAGSIRMLGSRKGSFACVVRQLPGETTRHSAGFTITECGVIELAATVVGALPAAPAGRQSDVVLVDEDDGMDRLARRSQVRWSLEDEDSAETRRSDWFRGAPANSAGTIEIVQGRSRFGPRGTVRYSLGWRDLVGDGRYLTTSGTPPVATAVDAERMTIMINRVIAEVVRSIKDEWA